MYAGAENKMKVRIKNGNCPDHLSHNHEYEVIHALKDIFAIKDNSGDFIDINLCNCPHLNGGSWEIVE